MNAINKIHLSNPDGVIALLHATTAAFFFNETSSRSDVRRLDRLNSRISLQIIVENSRNSEFCDSNYHSSLLAVQAAAFPYTAIIAEEGLVPKATIRLSGCVNISFISSQLSLRTRVPGRPTQLVSECLITLFTYDLSGKYLSGSPSTTCTEICRTKAHLADCDNGRRTAADQKREG